MNANEPHHLLGSRFMCECGREHTVSIQHLWYEPDVLHRMPQLLLRVGASRAVNLIADTRTRAVMGLALTDTLTSAGFRVHSHVLPDSDHVPPVCDDVTMTALRRALVTPCDALVAVGSGVVNDLTKWLSTDTGLPYLVVPTAASMNGYASENIAPAIRGVKRVLPGSVPFAIAADPDVIRNAPFELTAAGLGDVLAKPVSITDWQINHALFDEYYCPFCARLIKELEPLYLEHPERLRQRDPSTLKALFIALVYSGVSMTLAGTSFPASGGEHLVSHVLDMQAGLHGTPHDLHGRQVGLGTLFASALYERLRDLDTPSFAVRVEETDTAFWKRLNRVVEEEHARKRQRARRAVGRLRQPGVWDRLRSMMEATTMPPAAVKACLKQAGAAHCIDDIGCTREEFLQAALHGHQIRERYTVLDLGRAAGVLPQAAPEIVDQYLVS